ncbi:MAG: rRNA small subunit methyltransferase 1, partial [Clostridia bacterium]|nr:rRNA small subunit methyltransferase 1 [Clostridia bacterium]
MPQLYVVATPIGNLGDLSPRAVQTLRDCALIAAEDTRVTRKLLTRFGINTPMVSHHRHNEAARTAELLDRMLAEDLAVALVTDAGTPCISDPGYLLVDACVNAGIAVLPIPGPSAMAAALSISGFDCQEFAFYGFLPRT